ncbi:MAG: glycoside hydrolase [Ruminococcus sp.]|nr:glycoside hydrolase [Ruminococcus sp.]
MKILRKTAALVIAAFLSAASLAGCEEVGRLDMSLTAVPGSTQPISGVSSDGTEPTTVPADIYPDYPVIYPEIQQQDTGDLYEAENCILGGLSTSTERDNYSGTGYVTGFSADAANSLTFNVTVPSNQHYDLSFCIASDAVSDCSILLNDEQISSFSTTDDGAFTIITVYGIFLINGESEVTLRAENGNIDLDYMKLSNNTTLSEISYETGGELANENAGESAKELMSFLSEAYGDYVITGQYVSDETNSELDLIYRTTGKYPVIRFSAIGSTADCAAVADAAAKWNQSGGIVGLMWHWEAPGETPSVYSEKTDFKLSDAVTDEDIAMLSQVEISALCESGSVSGDCYKLICDIDAVSEQLLTLKENDIPVLWRPLHEASGDWFWWGASGTDAYKWLWQLMYTRMTEYHGLDNLIWIWNGQSADTLVDKSTFDIAALDLYMGEGKELGSCYDKFAALQQLVGTDKLIAISECSSAPDVDASFRDNAVWSFFGLWYGGYLEGENGEYSEKFMPKDSFIRAYNSSGAITLDEYKAMKDGTYQPPATTAAATIAADETVTTTATETAEE